MILYVDCSAGVSGDMLLAGLLDLGLPFAKLRGVLRHLGLSGVRVRVRRIRRQGLQASRVTVHPSGGTGRPFRTAGQLIQGVRESASALWLKRSLLQALGLLARVEGRVHGSSFSRVLFHQLAEADTLVNLTGFCMGLRHFRVRALYASPIPLGSLHQGPGGRWVAQPGPATCRLLSRYATYQRRERFEWTTPTGALLLAAFGSIGPPPPLRVRGIGHGAGLKVPPQSPSALRLILGTPV